MCFPRCELERTGDHDNHTGREHQRQSPPEAGPAKLLRFDGPGGIALAGRSGPARVAWKVGTALPVVQCVHLRTTGNPLGGYTVLITRVDEPTALDEPC